MFKSKKVIGAFVGLVAAVVGAAVGADLTAIVLPLTEVISSIAG